MRSARDVLSGTILLALSVSYHVAARSLPSGQDEPGPAFFPALLAAALFVLGAAILVSGLRARLRDDGSAPLGKPLAVMVLTFGYAGAYAAVGFVPATLVYTSGLAYVFGRREPRRLVLIAAATTGFLHAVLGWGLGIPL